MRFGMKNVKTTISCILGLLMSPYLNASCLNENENCDNKGFTKFEPRPTICCPKNIEGPTGPTGPRGPRGQRGPRGRSGTGTSGTLFDSIILRNFPFSESTPIPITPLLELDASLQPFYDVYVLNNGTEDSPNQINATFSLPNNFQDSADTQVIIHFITPFNIDSTSVGRVQIILKTFFTDVDALTSTTATERLLNTPSLLVTTSNDMNNPYHHYSITYNLKSGTYKAEGLMLLNAVRNAGIDGEDSFLSDIYVTDIEFVYQVTN